MFTWLLRVAVLFFSIIYFFFFTFRCFRIEFFHQWIILSFSLWAQPLSIFWFACMREIVSVFVADIRRTEIFSMLGFTEFLFRTFFCPSLLVFCFSVSFDHFAIFTNAKTLFCHFAVVRIHSLLAMPNAILFSFFFFFLLCAREIRSLSLDSAGPFNEYKIHCLFLNRLQFFLFSSSFFHMKNQNSESFHFATNFSGTQNKNWKNKCK